MWFWKGPNNASCRQRVWFNMEGHVQYSCTFVSSLLLHMLAFPVSIACIQSARPWLGYSKPKLPLAAIFAVTSHGYHEQLLRAVVKKKVISFCEYCTCPSCPSRAKKQARGVTGKKSSSESCLQFNIQHWLKNANLQSTSHWHICFHGSCSGHYWLEVCICVAFRKQS